MDFNQELDKIGRKIEELDKIEIELTKKKVKETITTDEAVELELIPKKLMELKAYRTELITAAAAASKPSLTGKWNSYNFSLISIRYDSLLQSIFPL